MIMFDGMVSILCYLFEYRSLFIDLYYENYICLFLKLLFEFFWFIYYDSYFVYNVVKMIELIG